MNKKELVYVAGPYSHDNLDVMRERFRALNRYSAYLMKQGYVPFSPISHSHPIAVQEDVPTNWEFWKQQDERFLDVMDVLHVFQMYGWENSTGVSAEREYWKKIGNTVDDIVHVDPHQIFNDWVDPVNKVNKTAYA
jgi:hypothetical protein